MATKKKPQKQKQASRTRASGTRANGAARRRRAAAPPPAHVGIDESARRRINSTLAAALADQHVLYQKTRLCHWNLVGSRFDPLHAMFEAQYEALAEAIDGTAERIRMLDGIAPGSLRELCDAARLPEIDGELIDGNGALTLLLADHEAMVVSLRDSVAQCEDLDDVGTADFLTGLLRAHEKTAWMLRSHLAAGAA